MSDAQQFAAFMEKYQNMVFSTAARLLANATEAEDVAQEVFLRAYKHFDEIKDSPTAGGWLKTVATNLSLNHLKRYRSRWRFFSEFFSSSEEEQEFEPPAPENLAEDVDRAEHQRLVEEAMQKLPDAQRVPLVLFHLDGMKYEDIAEKLNISVGKVKTDIFRGRAALRKRLSPQLAGEI